ncbi:MAG: helix-turn-helix domain-containing protein [Thermoplasmata archaeon]|nr:helix-turn-helix domain-containing protein [Thermoplasmata archaeon]
MLTVEAPTPSSNAELPPPPRDRKERILDALGDPVARQIILMLNDAPRSAQELLVANHVPQSTLYRRLHELEELGVVAVQRTVITEEGKRVDLYRSLLEEFKVELRSSRLEVTVKYRDLQSERVRELWGAVRKEAGR